MSRLDRAARPLTRRDKNDETPSANAWPSGARTMRCLACESSFVSCGRQERLCPSCRRHTP